MAKSARRSADTDSGRQRRKLGAWSSGQAADSTATAQAGVGGAGAARTRQGSGSAPAHVLQLHRCCCWRWCRWLARHQALVPLRQWRKLAGTGAGQELAPAAPAPDPLTQQPARQGLHVVLHPEAAKVLGREAAPHGQDQH